MGAPHVALRAPPASERESTGVKFEVQHLDFYYGAAQALKDVNLTLAGPPHHRIHRSVGLRQVDAAAGIQPHVRAVSRAPRRRARCCWMARISSRPRWMSPTLRLRVGMVFQKPTPFPMSIFDNVAFGLRLARRISRSELGDRVEEALRDAAMWEEVKDKLHEDGRGLSGGQQQRLCIARTIAVQPEVLLFDEPTAALDPISTLRVEETLQTLRERYCIAIVTHNLQQAARVSNITAFMYLGELVEIGPTEQIFTAPKDRRTDDYVTGRFG